MKNFFESSVMKTVNLTSVFMEILHRNSNDDIEVIIKILNSGVCNPVIPLPIHLNERDMNVIPMRASRGKDLELTFLSLTLIFLLFAVCLITLNFLTSQSVER